MLKAVKISLSFPLDKTKLDPVQVEIRAINANLRQVRSEGALLLDREQGHKGVASSTKRRVMWWFLTQVLLIGGVSYFQVYYLKRFFETRRLV